MLVRARLGKQSRLRNGAGHPDVGLAHAISRAFDNSEDDEVDEVRSEVKEQQKKDIDGVDNQSVEECGSAAERDTVVGPDQHFIGSGDEFVQSEKDGTEWHVSEGIGEMTDLVDRLASIVMNLYACKCQGSEGLLVKGGTKWQATEGIGVLTTLVNKLEAI